MPTIADLLREEGIQQGILQSARESYKKLLTILEEFEDRKETKILSQSVEFKKLVKKGLEDMNLDRIKPWKELWEVTI